MKKIASFLNLILLFIFVTSSLNSQAQKTLWQIGTSDNNYSEFALSPNLYDHFLNDGLFIVGKSDAKKTWPYVQPGPSDGWAGSREHTFSIHFGIAASVANGQCKLVLDLVDTHSTIQDQIKIQLNGKDTTITLPKGGGDASIFGDPTKGRQYITTLTFPASTLKAGDNEIQISSIYGSWFLYDAIRFETPAEAILVPVNSQIKIVSTKSQNALKKVNGQLYQPVTLTLFCLGDSMDVQLKTGSLNETSTRIYFGEQTIETLFPAVEKDSTVNIEVIANQNTYKIGDLLLKPVRRLTIYVLPHSHTDIGYTEIQTAIETKQIQNLVQGIEIARKTKDYPEGARFVWNVEVLWAADLYLQRQSNASKNELLEAVNNGWVSFNGMYLNVLTGLSRPDELMQVFKYAGQLSKKYNTTIDAAMISDVPGYTWGTIAAMAHAGIKYFSVAPNYFDRIGDILVKWENKPFYWKSPSGNEKVLVWIPRGGYALSHTVSGMSEEFVANYISDLDKTNYPYDIAYIRWSGHGDNAVPDPTICEFIKEWNTNYEWPKFIISSTSTAFTAFEKKYGSVLPEVRGDWTPYWEDGAGSSALETGLNRASSDRLTQAETLQAMFSPNDFSASDYEKAWKKVLLYTEHTWGAWCSVSDPQNKATLEQWTIKKGYADQANSQSKVLFNQAASTNLINSSVSVDVANTNSWLRSDIVVLTKEQSVAGDKVLDDLGNQVSSQRLSSGELVFLASTIPPYTTKRFRVVSGASFSDSKVEVNGVTLSNDKVKVEVDTNSGAIKWISGTNAYNFAGTTSTNLLNDFLFFNGANSSDIKRNSKPTITVKENGPLVASLLIESDAPACNKLSREIRLFAGADYVEIINVVDKKRASIPGDADYNLYQGKESLNFGFPFKLTNPVVRIDVPFGIMRPEIDQIPSACKNWFTMNRWADVSNESDGITLVSQDAPLLQVGGLTANLPGSQSDPNVWRKTVPTTSKLYSWAMNNHWGTNYRAYQDGIITFRYALRPHTQFSASDASKFAIGLSQPLVPVQVPENSKLIQMPKIVSDNILVTAYKPSDDGKAFIVQLFNTSDKSSQAIIQDASTKTPEVWQSTIGEDSLKLITDTVTLPGYGVMIVRIKSLYSLNTSLSSTKSSTEKIHIFPNPVKDILTISNGKDYSTFIVTNLNGQILLSKKNPEKSSDINLSSIEQGIYLLKGINQTGKTELLGKFIKS